MKFDEFLFMQKEIMKEHDAPYIFHNAEYSKDFYDELVARTSYFVITYHEMPGFQAVCVTDEARIRLSSILKKQLMDLSVRIDRLKCCIDEIEDSFLASGRRLE